MILIGIDPGVKTGIAVWDCEDREFLVIDGLKAIQAEFTVLSVVKNFAEFGTVFLRIEDARKRKWFGKNAAAKRMGAGSVKRDSQRWQEFCEFHEIPYSMEAPSKGMTKIKAAPFKAMTGYEGRTNEHGRDAAMLVYGFTTQQAKGLIEHKQREN